MKSRSIANEVVWMSTLHEKHKVVGPALGRLGLQVRASPWNTDQLGTFSGEIPRKLSVRQCLEAKLDGIKEQGHLLLASEGTFLPHPLGFTTDVESLLLRDLVSGREFYAESRSEAVYDRSIQVTRPKELADQLPSLFFSGQGWIVRTPDFSVVVKDVVTPQDLETAVQQVLAQAGQVYVQADLRAHRNPARQKVILAAAHRLVDLLESRCPRCDAPGWKVIDVVRGLPCESCGTPSRAVLSEVWACGVCGFSEQRPRPDGRDTLPVEECEVCNP